MQEKLIHEISSLEALEAAEACGASTLLFPTVAAFVEFRRRSRGMDAGVYVAVSDAGSPALDAELDSLGSDLPDGVVLADCRGRADLQRLSVKLAVREALAKRPEGVVRILAMAGQSAAGVLALPDLAGGARRLAGLAHDPETLARAIGVVPAASTVQMAGSQVVFAAAACSVPAFFVPPRQQDAGALIRGYALARRAGFAGAILKTPAHFVAIRQAQEMIDKRPRSGP